MARNPGRTVFIADYAFSDAGVIDSAIAGHDKPSSNDNKSVLLNHVPSSNGNNPVMPKLNPIPLPKPTQIMRCSDMPVSHIPAYPVVNGRIGGYGFSSTPYPNGFHPQGEILS
ncbi:RNA-binding (RRM/RBD/RNP motifs) family protein [Zea mays]|uniref:RNA-binding (RRM/RBD/RNP motifs) family protein n=1 Tax=Zea mays TaxID=4577 RepID=A0A1D6N5R2_MAIZE|nr:RNA-binding (RRM/RBD/RNP motifs) family protein [Zea mays]